MGYMEILSKFGIAAFGIADFGIAIFGIAAFGMRDASLDCGVNTDRQKCRVLKMKKNENPRWPPDAIFGLSGSGPSQMRGSI